MTVVDQVIPPRPRAVVLGVPYLMAMWAVLAASFFTVDGAGDALWPMIFWTVIWYTVLYRVWRGGRLAVGAVTVLTTVISPFMILGAITLVVVMETNGLPGMFRDLPATFYLGIVGYAGAFVVGIGLRRQEVREWTLALHPPKTRAEAAVLGAPSAAAGPAALTEPAAPAEPVTIDLGAGIQKQARFRIGCFAVLLCFFPGLPLVIGLVQVSGDGDYAVMIPIAGLLVAFVIALVVSYWRFRRRLGAGATLTIDDSGVSVVVGAERAELQWTTVDGIGISYYLAQTRTGQKMHLPQLDIFEDPSYLPGRHPLLETHRRTERPPNPALPPERYRLMLPAIDDVHRQIETAVRAYQPALWLGWYERARSDSPWFLR